MVAYYWALIAAVAIERLIELRISKRNYEAAMRAGGKELFPRHFRAMAAMHTLFLIACVVEAPLREWRPGIGITSLVGVVAAQAIRYWVIATLGQRWNVRIVVWPNLPLIKTGPYKYVRHPNYVAVVLEIIALPLVYGCWVTAAVFTVANSIVLAVRIPAEETALVRNRAK